MFFLKIFLSTHHSLMIHTLNLFIYMRFNRVANISQMSLPFSALKNLNLVIESKVSAVRKKKTFIQKNLQLHQYLPLQFLYDFDAFL